MDNRPNIEGFELLDVIGQGGMGTVYLARQQVPSRLVAVKVIHSHLADDPQFRARFESEMKVAVELDHPNLVPLIDANESNGNLYMAFQLVRGKDLKQLIRDDGPVSPDEAVRIISQLSSALEYVHESGIIHRDVKPSNIIVDERNGHVYLSDFGIAKARDASQALTGSSAAIGAIDYIAPEQFEPGEPDGRVDVYAEGCVLFELLTGQTPFEEESLASLMRAKLDSKARTVSDVGVSAPSELEEVISTALERDPDERFSSPTDLSRAASDALRGNAPTRAIPRSGSDRTERIEKTRRIPHAPTDSQPATAAGRFLRKPAVVGSIVVLVLVAAGLAISSIGSGGGDADSGSSASKSKLADGPETETVGTSEPAESEDSSLSPVSTTLVEAKVPKGWEPLRETNGTPTD